MNSFIASITGFVLGAIPLLAFAFFSPGIDSESPWGYATLALAIAVLIGLTTSALRRKWVWGLVAVQILLLGLVLYEAFSNSALYFGT
jgi:hypothetical protein